MRKATPKRNNQRNTKGNGGRITRTKRKPKCGANPSTLQDIKTNGAKGVEKNNTVQGTKKITGLKLKNTVVENVSGSGTSAKNMSQKSGDVTAGSNAATEHNLPPQTALRGNDNKDLSRNKRNDTESDEEELVSTAGSSEEATEEEISDEEEEQRDRSVSAEGDSSEENTESSGSQRNTEQTAINSVGKETFVESKCSSSSEVNTHASRTEEEDTRVDTSAGLKDETQDKEVSQEDTSEGLTAVRTRGQRARFSCTSTPVKESKYKMFKRTKGDKQAQKDEKRRVKAEKQRLEKEAKQKAKEEKKKKKKPQKAEKHASVTKEIQSAGISFRKYKKTNRKSKSEKQTKNTEDDACGIANMSDEEDDEGEPALTKAIKGQNRIMQLKEKGKDLRNLLTQPETETSESEPLVLESNQVGQHLIAQRKGAATFHRVSGWIQKNVPQKLNLRKKLSAWTKAMGISRWLSVKVIKQNRSPKKSKSSIVKHRMALRVASKTSLVSKNKMAKEKAGVGGDDVVTGEEKDIEAKYAVVLPRMNELGKTKMAEISQVAPSPSAPLSMTETPSESISSESKPPKPGARLVLPVKPDLSLLKSIKKPLPGDLAIGGSFLQRTPDPTQALEDSLNTGKSNRKVDLESRDGASVLQAARRKLDPSQINLTKMSLSGGAIGPTQARGPDPERDAAVGIPRSVTQPFPNGEVGMGVSGASPICEEETDREVAQLMCEGGKYGISQPEVHWAGNPQMSGDPQVGSTLVFKVHFYQYATFVINRVNYLTLSRSGLAAC